MPRAIVPVAVVSEHDHDAVRLRNRAAMRLKKMLGDVLRGLAGFQIPIRHDLAPRYGPIENHSHAGPIAARGEQNARGRLPQKTENLFKYIFSDVYSSGKGMIMNVPGILTLDNDNSYLERKDHVQYDTKIAGRYIYFLRENPYLFSGNEPAKIGILHSLGSRKVEYLPLRLSGDSNLDFIGFLDLLLDLNVPFHTIVSGDDIYKKDIQIKDIEDYQVIIIPSVKIISENEIDVLLKYVRGGGIVIQTGDFALYNKNFEINEHTQKESLKNQGIHNIGFLLPYLLLPGNQLQAHPLVIVQGL